MNFATTRRASTRTIGIDLSAEPARTAAVTLEWSGDACSIVEVSVGVENDRLVEMVGGEHPVGIDCPLGWPDAFVELVSHHHAQSSGSMSADRLRSLADDRRPLSNRATDLWVREHVGVRPMSVSADRLGACAMRLALVFGIVERTGAVIPRDGSAGVFEVYPAATLKRWGIPHTGYKPVDQAPRREQILDAIGERFPGLDLGPHRGQFVRSDHALDALVCALTTRAAMSDRTTAPPPELREVAGREGWIHVPV
ncbi:DUF429 domain-containing protein [Calidifontibacter terrae]